MRNKKVMILALFAVMAAMTGIASATCQNENNQVDCIVSQVIGANVHTDVTNLKTAGGGHWYVLRYHPPETLVCNSGTNVPDNSNCFAELKGKEGESWVPDGSTAGDEHFSDSSSNNFYDETRPLSSAGWTIVSLWHKGNAGCNPNDGTGCTVEDTVIMSYKVYTFVQGIPEFPTVALPIAAVIGLVFFFQNRKKKEE